MPEKAGFDAFVEGLCAWFYADGIGRPSLRPGRYVRMLLVRSFEGLNSERAISCQRLDLSLYVLPPRRPQCNGCVERAQFITRFEFRNFYDGELRVAGINQALQEHLHFYHHRRPHRTLGLLTPQAFLADLPSVAWLSHMYWTRTCT